MNNPTPKEGADTGATRTSPPAWVHVDDLQARGGFTFGEAVLSALPLRWAYFAEPDGRLGVAVAVKPNDIDRLRDQFARLRRETAIPLSHVDAEVLAGWHNWTLSEFVWATKTGCTPQSAVFSSRRIWFSQTAAEGWVPPTYSFMPGATYAG